MTSPASSPAPPPPPLSNFASLPVHAMKEKIVEKIQQNRVTLIVGEPGCGKSSQVPQFLLEENMEPILCTQPRRFAVVAVASMVAEARKCLVGEEIGYHIGHSRVFSASSKILFKTAGVLLEEMRERGLKALNYKVIILDEVHERSVESDLVLLCVKQYMLKSSSLRLVLMSATADISKYRDYFRDLGRGERVEVLAIPTSISQQNIFQRKVLYLEQVTELLHKEQKNLSSALSSGPTPLMSNALHMTPEILSLKYCSGPTPVMADAGLNAEVHKLIHDLVLYIHKNETDIEKSILVFLPTYSSLEQQWSLLKPFSGTFKVHILHSSVETEQALKAMSVCKSHRKIVLATNIAESSVTIPQVGYVIDSCRSLQVFWDNNRKVESAELVWVSKSQADQRKGRTGRTCDGHVFRLVSGSFFSQLEDYDPPAILRLSLRQQVLLLCCSETKAVNDPRALLQKALDPPHHEVVEDALDFLENIHALERAPRGRHEPTFYGLLLSTFSLSFDASVLVLKFGDLGLLREGILLGILMDMQPLPILRPFGHENLHVEYASNYFARDGSITGLTGRKEVLYMGNLCAFQFWQLVFKDKYRLEQLKKLLKSGGVEDDLTEIEAEWCSFHYLVQSALNQVAEIYDEVVHSLHRFRPKSLLKSSSLPLYYEPREYQHTCFLNYNLSDHGNDNGDLDVKYDMLRFEDDGVMTCAAAPFVCFNHFQTPEVAKKFATVVKEMRHKQTEIASEDNVKYAVHYNGYLSEATLCRFFLMGLCNRGSHCLYSHSLQAKREPCKFFYSLQGCRNGESCYFSHSSGPSSSVTGGNPYLWDAENADADSLLRLFPESSDGRILLLDDADLHFSVNLARFCDPSRLITTTPLQYESTIDPALTRAKILWGLSHPNEAIIHKSGESLVPWNKVKCVLWFPQSGSAQSEGETGRIKTLFQHLSLRMLVDGLSEVLLIITMNNLRFSLLQVEKLARDAFFFLKESFPFDEERFGEVGDKVTTSKSMLVCKPISYVFSLRAPSETQFGDYRAELKRHLHRGF